MSGKTAEHSLCIILSPLDCWHTEPLTVVGLTEKLFGGDHPS